MNSDQSNTQNIRQVYLPSGKRIEIVYLAGQAPAERRPDTPPAGGREVSEREQLHICPRCSSGMVHPIDWSEAGGDHWEVALRCPECEWREIAVFAQAHVEALDAVLDDGSELLLNDLQHLTHANMSDSIDRFVKALNAGQILPCDF